MEPQEWTSYKEFSVIDAIMILSNVFLMFTHLPFVSFIFFIGQSGLQAVGH